LHFDALFRVKLRGGSFDRLFQIGGAEDEQGARRSLRSGGATQGQTHHQKKTGAEKAVHW
jgi:hypothetical protein